MIPKGFIIEWSKTAPWINNYQVEQDLVIERCLIEIFSDDILRENLAFRGGTALHKLFLSPQVRYSEDIDLVQTSTGDIGYILTRIRDRLAFMGEAGYHKKEHNNTLYYRFNSEYENIPLKLKVEINTREHFSTYPFAKIPFSLRSGYFSGNCIIRSYQIEELLATKLRALYQRKKGRDLFDLWYAISKATIDFDKVVFSFKQYLTNENNLIRKKEFILNVEKKLRDVDFIRDVKGLLRSESEFDVNQAWTTVRSKMIDKI